MSKLSIKSTKVPTSVAKPMVEDVVDPNTAPGVYVYNTRETLIGAVYLKATGGFLIVDESRVTVNQNAPDVTKEQVIDLANSVVVSLYGVEHEPLFEVPFALYTVEGKESTTHLLVDELSIISLRDKCDEQDYDNFDSSFGPIDNDVSQSYTALVYNSSLIDFQLVGKNNYFGGVCGDGIIAVNDNLVICGEYKVGESPFNPLNGRGVTQTRNWLPTLPKGRVNKLTECSLMGARIQASHLTLVTVENTTIITSHIVPLEPRSYRSSLKFSNSKVVSSTIKVAKAKVEDSSLRINARDIPELGLCGVYLDGMFFEEGVSVNIRNSCEFTTFSVMGDRPEFSMFSTGLDKYRLVTLVTQRAMWRLFGRGIDIESGISREDLMSKIKEGYKGSRGLSDNNPLAESIRGYVADTVLARMNLVSLLNTSMALSNTVSGRKTVPPKRFEPKGSKLHRGTF